MAEYKKLREIEIPSIRGTPSTMSVAQQKRCDLTCVDLVSPELYGSKPIPEPNLLAIENRLDQQIIDAMDARDFIEIMESRRDRNCFFKWRDECIPKVNNVQSPMYKKEKL